MTKDRRFAIGKISVPSAWAFGFAQDDRSPWILKGVAGMSFDGLGSPSPHLDGWG
jgi:hypothetical protein